MNDFDGQSPATPRPSAADLIRRGESLMVEFKSDRKCLPDQELVCAAVALANSDGGVVLVGVEDDGTVTGCTPNTATSKPQDALSRTARCRSCR